MKRSVVMIAPFNTRSGYGDHARSLFYSIMDREDLDIKLPEPAPKKLKSDLYVESLPDIWLSTPATMTS